MFLSSLVLHFISWLLFFAWFILSQMSLEELLAKPKIHCHLFALFSFAFRCFGLLAHCTRLLTALDASRCTALALLPASLERKRILSNFLGNSQKVGCSKEFFKKNPLSHRPPASLTERAKSSKFLNIFSRLNLDHPSFCNMEELIIRMGKPRAGCPGN